MSETKLNYYDLSYGVRSMTKTRQDNDVIDRIGAVYTDIRTELSWPIRKDTVYHKKQTK